MPPDSYQSLIRRSSKLILVFRLETDVGIMVFFVTVERCYLAKVMFFAFLSIQGNIDLSC